MWASWCIFACFWSKTKGRRRGTPCYLDDLSSSNLCIRTHKMVKYIMMMAVIRGMLTAASSAATMILVRLHPMKKFNGSVEPSTTSSSCFQTRIGSFCRSLPIANVSSTFGISLTLLAYPPCSVHEQHACDVSTFAFIPRPHSSPM
jgi:hypothetical protein